MPRPREDDDEPDDRRRKPSGPPVALVVGIAACGALGLVALAGLTYLLWPAAPTDLPAPQTVAVPGQVGGVRNAAPAEEPLPAGQQELSVTQVRRLHDRGEVKLQVQYELTRGQDVTGELCVAVRSADGSVHRLPVQNGFRHTEMPGAKLPRGAVDLSRGWLAPEFAGTLAVWVERGGLPDGGPRISNVFQVRF